MRAIEPHLVLQLNYLQKTSDTKYGLAAEYNIKRMLLLMLYLQERVEVGCAGERGGLS
jgi:hypothetical protein